MFTTVFTDITQRKLAEEIVKASLREKELLLREINHRVKNNLQIINSLFNLQMLKLKDGAARDILRESLSRVKAIAGVHEKLYKCSSFTRIDVGVYFADLIRSIALSFEADSSRVKIDIRVENGVEFEMDRAVTCGLIMNELVTNAFKYAFPGFRSGTIAVEFARDPAGRMYLRVSDDGVGLPPDFDHLHTATLGLELVATLSEQLGTLVCERSRGTSFTVTFAPEGADHER
jgi:two-component sensor histidine kinase